MRQFISLFTGLLQFAAAIVLVWIAWLLPGAADVERVSTRVEKVGRNASQQVGAWRERIDSVRQRKPEWTEMAQRLEKQMQTINENLDGRSFQGDGLKVIGSALDELAQGLEQLAKGLDGPGLDAFGKGLTSTADYLERRVVPGAEQTAQALEEASKSLRTDARQLSALLEDAPLELKAARELVDTMAHFEEGLQRTIQITRPENVEAMYEGFKGMQSALQAGAEQVDRLSTYTIPRVSVKGLKLDVEEKSFWPDSSTVSDGMRKAARGCETAAIDLEAINKDMPRFRQSLIQSQRMVRLSRESLTAALSRQEKAGPLLQKLPRQLAKLTGDLPELALDLAEVLRETGRLKDVVAALRQAEKAVTTIAARSPQLHQGLLQSATVLRKTKKQLHLAVEQGDEYESLLRNTVTLATTFSEAIPTTLEELEEGLEEQESSLEELQTSIDHVNDLLPGMTQSGRRLLALVRLLVVLLALGVNLHGSYSLYTGLSQGKIRDHQV